MFYEHENFARMSTLDHDTAGDLYEALLSAGERLEAANALHESFEGVDGPVPMVISKLLRTYSERVNELVSIVENMNEDSALCYAEVLIEKTLEKVKDQ